MKLINRHLLPGLFLAFVSVQLAADELSISITISNTVRLFQVRANPVPHSLKRCQKPVLNA